MSSDSDPVRAAVEKCLRKFLRDAKDEVPTIDDSTDLITGIGASSDEGVDFAIDLSDALGVEVPHDFNPFVDDSGKRGRRFGELVNRAKGFVAGAKGDAHGR